MARDKNMNERIIKLFLDCILNEDIIPDEMIQAFVVRTKAIVEQDYYEPTDDSFAELSDLVNDYWRNEQYEHEKNAEVAFQMGRLLSCITMLNLSLNEKEKEEAAIVDARHFAKYKAIFDLINRKPGIQSGMLATELDRKPSRISQIMNEITQSNYVIERKKGREKYYLLSQSGEHLLQKIDEYNSSDSYGWLDSLDTYFETKNKYYPGEEGRKDTMLSQKDLEEVNISSLYSVKNNTESLKKNDSESLKMLSN